MDCASHVTRICMRHGTHMDESCQTHRWVMSHVWMSHVAHVDESCHTYAMEESCHTYASNTWFNGLCKSCHAYEWVMSHIFMSHATHMHESCHTYAWVMSHICMSHFTHMHESSRTRGMRGGGLGSRPKKMYGERLWDGVEYHLMSPTPRR